MSTTETVLKPKLAAFAAELLAAGFKVYLPSSDIKRVQNGGLPQVGNWFQFSREVEGQTCYASVSLGFFEAPEFSMPIRPSVKNGSSMWLADNARQQDMRSEALTVENAKRYASMSGYNPLVGTQLNYHDERFAHLYTEVAS